MILIIATYIHIYVYANCMTTFNNFVVKQQCVAEELYRQQK